MIPPDRSLDEVLAAVGHELRNPLAPIVTALQVMRIDGHDSREQEVIERQVRRLVRIVDELLDVARLSSGRLELRAERVELAAVVARGIAEASSEVASKRQHVEVDVPRELVVHGDAARLAQVIASLIANASAHAREGTVIAIAARAAGDGDTNELGVRDRGDGIDPAALDEIFTPFARPARGGLGVGLAIARGVVELHGGTIRAHSEGAGRGSELIVSLPSVTASVGARADSASAPRPS